MIKKFVQVKTKPQDLRTKIEEHKKDCAFYDDLWDSKKGADVFHRRLQNLLHMYTYASNAHAEARYMLV